MSCDKKVLLLIILLVSVGNYFVILSQSNIEIKTELTPYLTKIQSTFHNNMSSKHEVGRYDIVWLMSYPNSGTSYTLHLVEKSTETSTGTNYAQEPRNAGHLVKRLNENDGGLGPFIHNSSLPLPQTKYVLTKTHCSGYCQDCPPKRYIVNNQEFETSCAECTDEKNSTFYGDIYTIDRAIHLIRNPLDNIVSNFHHWRGKQKRKGNEIPFDDTPIGFKEYCKLYHSRFLAMNVTSRPKIKRLESFFDGVPCHQTFFRFIQWHNNADAMENVERLLIYYDDYENNFDTTSDRVLNYLGLKPTKQKPLFKTGKSYQHYFTESEKIAIWKLINKFAIDSVWDKLSRYHKKSGRNSS